MPIPAKKSPVVATPANQLTLIYGAPKCGKSTLAACFPDSVFLATEAGLNNLEAVRWEYPDGKYVIRKWEDLLSAAREVLENKAYKTIIIDTIGNACSLADRYVCEKGGVEYRGDGSLGYGKGGAMIINEIKRFLTALSGTGIGLVLIAHSTTKALDTPAGELVKTRPHIPGDNKSEDIYSTILGMCDLVLFLDQNNDGSRVIRTKPKPQYDAGDRTGRLPDTLPATYAALSGAFAPAKPTQVAATK